MSLRDDILKYEAETGEPMKCFGLWRCHSCPGSFLGCPMARATISKKEDNK